MDREEKNNKKLIYTLHDTFKEPWWSAGQKFGFNGAGVSISWKHMFSLDEDGKIILFIKSPECQYEITKKKARELVKRYSSTWKNEKGEACIVIPVNELTPLFQEKPKPKKNKAKKSEEIAQRIKSIYDPKTAFGNMEIIHLTKKHDKALKQ